MVHAGCCAGLSDIALDLDAPAQPSALFVVGPFLCQTVIIVTTAILLRALETTTPTAALEVGLLIGFGYLLPMVVDIAINPKFSRPMLYSLTNAPFFILGSVMSSMTLVAFG